MKTLGDPRLDSEEGRILSICGIRVAFDEPSIVSDCFLIMFIPKVHISQKTKHIWFDTVPFNSLLIDISHFIKHTELIVEPRNNLFKNVQEIKKIWA